MAWGRCELVEDGLYFNVYGPVFMRKWFGAGVSGFKANFRLYRTDVTAGFNFPRLEREYGPKRGVNDDKTRGAWLPIDGEHKWTSIFTTGSYRLQIKMSWIRCYRRDFTYTYREIATCIG